MGVRGVEEKHNKQWFDVYPPPGSLELGMRTGVEIEDVGAWHLGIFSSSICFPSTLWRVHFLVHQLLLYLDPQIKKPVALGPKLEAFFLIG
jgi:hypothetical protein